MSTISLNFGVHTRNWPRIDLQPLEFNSEFYVWGLRGGGGGGACFSEFQKGVKIVGLYIKHKTSSRWQKIAQNNNIANYIAVPKLDVSFFPNLTHVNFGILSSQIKNKKHVSPEFPW